MFHFSRVSRFALASLACAASPAFARDCAPASLGASEREIVIGPKGAAVGLQSYPQTLVLGDHEVVLTFDDGPVPGPTSKVLDALAKECARATFFIIGHNAESTPALVKRAAEEGHSIGHHSYSHPANTLRLMEDGAARADIEKGIKAVEKAAGVKTAPFFRFPGFADTPSLVAHLEGKNFTIFGSDLWASDWSPMTPKGELELVMKRLEKEGKGIILFHDSKLQTAQMLPDFLQELKTRGYRLVHVVPGDGETPLTEKKVGWTSTTEPIIAKTLGAKRAAPGHSHSGDAAGGEDHAHPPADQ